MRGVASAILCGVVVVGCSSTSPDEPAPSWAGTPAVSGSRLRARYVTGGGARELVAFFDTARNEECTFQAAADGTMRCLPSAVTSVGTGASGWAFSDAECRQRAVVLGACARETKYVATTRLDGCGDGPVTSIRPVLTPATSMYTANGSTCTIQPAISLQGAFTLGDEIPFSQFVDAEVATFAAGDVAERVAVASDGARQHLGFRIDSLDADCTFQVMADGVTRCVPTAFSVQLLYADSACTKAVAVLESSTSCPSTRVFRDRGLDLACDGARAIFGVAPETDGPAEESFFVPNSSSMTCTTFNTRFSGHTVRHLTNITASLPSAARRGVGEGRLVPALVEGARSADLVRGYHDVERSVDCTFTRAADGKLRCLPTGPEARLFFADPSCRSPGRLAAFTGSASCADSGGSNARVTSGPSCGEPPESAVTRVYALGSERRNVVDASLETSPGRCARVAGVNGVADAFELDPALFVEGTIVTE
ncbi:MAG: hypothetical protein KF819_34395 [Labilithrix sp.]|nr:hypothetical protein [Labilithrix sp.]